MKVNDLTRQLSILLNDLDNVTIRESTQIASINAGIAMVASVRPDVSTTITEFELLEGILQTLPSDCVQFLDVCYRLDKGKPVAPINIVKRQDWNRIDGEWMTGTPGATQEIAIDDRFPDRFWVNPPAISKNKLLLGYSTTPPTVAKPEDTFPLKNKYAQPVMEWAMYLLFSRDSNVAANQQRAADHRSTFFQLLGMTTQVDQAISPTIPSFKAPVGQG